MEILVQFQAEVPEERRRQILEATGCTLLEVIPAQQIVVARCSGSETLSAVMQRLRQYQGVVLVEPNHPVEPH